MVVVNLKVASGGDGEGEASMPRHARQQVIEERHSSGNGAGRRLGASIQIESHKDLRLTGDTSALGLTIHFKRAHACLLTAVSDAASAAQNASFCSGSPTVTRSRPAR